MGHFLSAILPLPPTYKKVLDVLQAYFPEACIAGGALRDLMFGGEVKDIDIFVPYDSDIIVPNIAHAAGWTPAKFPQGLSGYRIGARNEVLAVYSYEVPGVPFEVQVIIFLPPHRYDITTPRDHFMADVTRRMDFDACQIACDGRIAYHTLDFGLAYSTREFRLVNCQDAKQAERSLRRSDRFAKKYPAIPIDVSLAHEVIKSTTEFTS